MQCISIALSALISRE